MLKWEAFVLRLKKERKKIKLHTSNTHDHKLKGGSFGAWILHSFPSNQARLLYLWVKIRNKTNSRARQRESEQTQVSLAGSWYSGLVKCISQTLCARDIHPYCDPVWWPPSQVLKDHPEFISIPNPGLNRIEYILTPWHANVVTAEWQQAWPVNLLQIKQRPEQHLQIGGALI